VTVRYSPPPSRKLPPERLDRIKANLLEELGPKRPSVVSVVTWKRLVATAMLVLLVAVGGWIATRGGTDTASAAEVKAKLAEGLRFSQSIRGGFSVRTQYPGPRPRGIPGCWNCTPVVPVPSKFVIGADGSYSSITLPLDATIRNDVAYDASTGIETSIPRFSDPETGLPLYVRASNLDPASQRYAPEAQLGAWAQGVVATRNPRIENTTFDDRSAWKLTVTPTPGTSLYDFYGARVDVVVDQSTGLVLEVTRYAFSTDRWTSIERVHDLKIGGPTSDADFMVPKPSGVRELVHDYGFRRVSVKEAASVVGYQPLVPSDTLGRSQSDFAVAKLSKPLLDVPGAPIGRDVVSARYGRGPDSITVSTRLGKANEVFELLGGVSSRTVHLTSGPLVGDHAYVSTTPLVTAIFSAFHRGLLVQILAPSASDAIAIANSLRASA
jgi:hypothetical protein